MKPQLTLKHLTPYLPFELLFAANGSTYQMTIASAEKQDVYVEIQDDFVFLGHWAIENGLKPILRPLSDYTDITSKAMSDLNCDLTNQMDIQEFALKKMSLSSLLYSSFEVLTRNHVDIFGLIPEGLAIDINTL